MMLVSWIVFPLLLVVLCFGCGLLVEAAVGLKLPGTLLAPAGFALVTVLAGIFTSFGATASLATPAVVAAALAGFALALLRRSALAAALARVRSGFDGWAIAAALGVFLVYGAPVILSGHPTFLGYIKLDDTATWMAFVDRLMSHGRDLSGLEPSSYYATLTSNFPGGYPLGAFLPLGVGTQLTGTDVAWLVQPYMATAAALLALCLYALAAPLLESRPLRALVAFGAAQSALLFAYSLWGGIKEVAVALAIAALAALAPLATRRAGGWRLVLPAAVATAALLAMLGSRGIVWIGPILLLAAVGLWRDRGPRALLARAVPLLAVVAALAALSSWDALIVEPTGGTITSASEIGNLLGPLKLAQFVGIWPTGDFRVDPINAPLAWFLIALAVLAAAAGTILAWRRRSWEPLLYATGTAAGSLAVFAASSPWVGAKGLASGSPALLFLALAGAAAFALRVERVLGGTVLGLLLVGVLWSNALGYHDVSLAPYDQLRELESVGEEFSGEGPTLMTEYQPYGVRHFLRTADAEGSSELRYRPIPLVEGGEAEKGAWTDTDQISFHTLLTYRTLVLRRNPEQSRPPAIYSLVRRGAYYEVWQRPASELAPVSEHLPLGAAEEPAGIPHCPDLLRLAAYAGPQGTVAAAVRRPQTSLSLGESERPEDWEETEAGELIPRSAGTAALIAELPSAGRYNLFLRGSTRNRLDLMVDGEKVGSVDQQLNQGGQYLDFGVARLAAGRHRVELVLHGQTLGPGSGGPPEAIGPLVFAPVVNEDPPVSEVPAAKARELCGQRLDWVEALP